MLLSLMCAYAGWGCLYRVMIWSTSVSATLGISVKAWLRGCGVLLLLCALGASVWQWGGSIGFVAWWILLAVSAWSLTIIMAFRQYLARASRSCT